MNKAEKTYDTEQIIGMIVILACVAFFGLALSMTDDFAFVMAIFAPMIGFKMNHVIMREEDRGRNDIPLWWMWPVAIAVFSGGILPLMTMEVTSRNFPLLFAFEDYFGSMTAAILCHAGMVPSMFILGAKAASGN